ncbi:hypothetical protein [Streptomyces sp. NPDC046332]|uniref:hypothetical protein n=1 Tax=unclassified Streptomyces TaxID=2593676 RepID=UPI0033FBF143
MTLKDIAERAAVLGALHDAIGAELKQAKADLQAGLKAAKEETGTQQIGMTLGAQDIGKVTLVQPKAQATVTDLDALTKWVRTVAKSEVTARVVTEIRPAWLTLLLKQLTATGRPEWADPETGVIHDVPGVAMQGRTAHTRMTVTDTGQQAIAEAWRTGQLTHLVLPQLTTKEEA